MPDPGRTNESFLYLIQYVPNLVSGESLNVGILLYCPGKGYLGCMVTRNLHRIARFHLQADMDFFRELPSYFKQLLAHHPDDPKDVLRSVRAYSNAIQLTPPRVCLLEDPESEMKKLFVHYIGAEFS